MSRVSDLCHQLRSCHGDDSGAQADDDSSSNEHSQVLRSALEGRAENDEKRAQGDGLLASEDLAELRREGCRHEDTDVDGVDERAEIRA